MYRLEPTLPPINENECESSIHLTTQGCTFMREDCGIAIRKHSQHCLKPLRPSKNIF